jgi:dCTP diphosphatase
MDTKTSVAELRASVRAFVKDRNWERYHTPKDLSMAIAIEAAELMERFQWMSGADSGRVVGTEHPLDPPPSRKPTPSPAAAAAAVQDELADILILCLAFANAAEVDVAELVERKLATNRRRYPVAD